MRLTAYNLIMSLVWSSLCIVIFCLLRRNYNFIQKYGVFPLIAVLLLGLFRFFVPIELPYTRLIQSYDILPGIQQWSRRSSGLFSLSYGALLLGLWAAVSTILAARLFLGIALQRRAIAQLPRLDSEDAERAMEELLAGTKHRGKYTLIVSPKVQIPSVVGFFSPTVLLPDMELSREELKYILRHELSHFAGRDAWVKLFIGIFQAIFWWNPLVYGLRKDLDYVLELRCDARAVRELSGEQRIGYVEAVCSVIRQAKGQDSAMPNYALALSGRYGKSMLVERMKLVLSQNTPARRLPAFFVCAMVLFLLASYAVVIQPASEPPVEEIEGYVAITPETAYIRHEDGHYFLCVEGSFVTEILPEELKTAPYDSLEIREGG